MCFPFVVLRLTVDASRCRQRILDHILLGVIFVMVIGTVARWWALLLHHYLIFGLSRRSSSSSSHSRHDQHCCYSKGHERESDTNGRSGSIRQALIY